MQVADLGGVQKTLLLPLWGRAVETPRWRWGMFLSDSLRVMSTVRLGIGTAL
jgi:hypothetical protein